MNPHIREALRLPDSSAWPPDYYTLLGLTPDTATPEAVELAVLDRMERLRAYQLAHPDEVTEAMNLLARALGELADAGIGNRESGIGNREKSEVRSQRSEVGGQGSEIANSEVGKEGQAKPSPTPVFPIPDSRLPTPVPTFRYHQTDDSILRRKIREVVAARRTLDAWDAAGPFFTATAWQPPTRFAAVQIVAALRQVAAMLPEESEEGPGGSVLALARMWPSTQTLLEMSDARRELLGDDWRAGRWELLDHVVTARKRVRRPKARRWWNLWKRQFVRQTPQMLAATLAVLAIVIAVYRWLA